MTYQPARIAMKRPANFCHGEDVQVAFNPPLVGRRFSMDINDEVLAQIGARAVEAMTDELGRVAVYRHEIEINAAIHAYLFDPKFMEPIIENEIRRTVRDFVLALWSDEEKAAMRDWFDVFTAKCLQSNRASSADQETR